MAFALQRVRAVRFIPRKVPGLSAHWLRLREGGGQPKSRAMTYDPGCPLPLCRRFKYFLFCPFVFVAQFAGYIRPPPSRTFGRSFLGEGGAG